MLKKSWRWWHRRVSVVAAVFLLFIGVSGLILQYQQLKYRISYPQEAPTAPKAKLHAHEIPEGLYEKLPALKLKIDELVPGAVIERIVLLLRGDQPTWSVYVQTDAKNSASHREETRLLSFNPGTLELLKNENFDYDSFWLSLHTGQALGDAGLGVNFLTAIVFLFVTVSGLVIFFRG